VTLFALASCSGGDGRSEAGAPGQPAQAGPDEHVVYLLDGKEPITQGEVDAWLECVGSMESNATLPQRRRLAITNIVLHRALSRLIDPAAHAEAGARAANIHARLLEGGEPGVDLPATEVIEGTWKDIGLDAWWLCKDAEVGRWAPPLETVGAYLIYRLLDEPPDPWRPNGEIRVELLRLPFIPEESPNALLMEAEESVRLEVLDPAWEELLPLVLRNRMRVVVREPRPRPTPED
jgi:hypothetical protein